MHLARPSTYCHHQPQYQHATTLGQVFMTILAALFSQSLTHTVTQYGTVCDMDPPDAL